MARLPGTHFRVSVLTGLTLLQNMLTSGDLANDADYTAEELLGYMARTTFPIPQRLFESALYCCNLNQEDQKFVSPINATFDQFIDNAIPGSHKFNRAYNVIMRNDEND